MGSAQNVNTHYNFKYFSWRYYPIKMCKINNPQIVVSVPSDLLHPYMLSLDVT